MPTQAQAQIITSALSVAKEHYVLGNPLSHAQHLKAAKVLPGGSTRTSLFSEPFPLTLASGSGSRVTSLDNREYVDFLGEFTAGLYGHSNPQLREAVIKALDHGWLMGGHTRMEEELGSLICSRIASIDLVRFTNSGTEANLYALLAARTITGKDKVMVFEGAYHGGTFIFRGPSSPLNVPIDFVWAPYNDAEGTLALLQANRSDIGAIIIEPMQGSAGCIPADHAFLQMLRKWATQNGSILIFDEVMTSRLTPGGLQAACGVAPDLTTLGKYIGGGFSFGAFGGREELMRHFDPLRPDALAHAGTFNNNVFTMSAGVVGLRDIYTAAAAIELSARGDALRERLNIAARRANFPMQFTGLGSMMNVHMSAGSVKSIQDLAQNNAALQDLFYFDLLDQGIWLARRGMVNVSLPINDADCDGLVAAVESFIDKHNGLLDGVGQA
jgi:glutamate-1-semialdehyde 2,1-aminomutase